MWWWIPKTFVTPKWTTQLTRITPMMLGSKPARAIFGMLM
jgi:hypothetical protein